MTHYEFDYYEKFSFFAIHALYRRLLLTIVTASLATILLRPMDAKMVWALVVSVVSAVIMEAWMTYRYEIYLHAKYPLNIPQAALDRDIRPGHFDPKGTYDIRVIKVGDENKGYYVGPSNYSTLAYALTIILGLTTLISFAAGMIRLAVVIGGVQ